jgi:hypothetical protein
MLSFALSQRAHSLAQLSSCRADTDDDGHCRALAAADDNQLRWLQTLLGTFPAIANCNMFSLHPVRQLR